MLYFLIYGVQILLMVVFLIVVVLLMLWSIGNFKNKVPFVAASNHVLKDIEKALAVNDNSVVYDLGCGDGRVLLHLAKNNPKAKYIGIENSPFPDHTC